MNNAMLSKRAVQSLSSAHLQATLSQLEATLSNANQVVICPLSLPDANWPEGLKHLNNAAKSALSNLLQARSIEIFNFDSDAIQNVGVGEAIIFHLLGFNSPNSPAAFSAASVTPPYIAIRPVSLHAGRDHVVLKQSDGSYASNIQLDQLAASIKPLFEQYGLALHTPYSADTSPAQRARWFITPTTDEGKQFFELSTSDSQQALGRNIDAYMAKGQSARRWRQLETEIQMTWFDHAVNSELRSKNLDQLNSIWIDGSISFEPKKPSWLNHIESQRASFTELANFWGLPPSFNANDNKNGCLRICDDWQARLFGDALAWLQAWESFLTEKANVAPGNVVVFAGETSCMILKPWEVSLTGKVKRKVSSFFRSLSMKNAIDRPEIVKAFGL
jgi:hypothetical protein